MCNGNCKLCDSIVISDSVSVLTVAGVDTLVIDIPAASYRNKESICLVIAQAIPDTATINMPVAISIGGVTTTVYPLVNFNCAQATACSVRTRTRYKLMIQTTPTGAIFKACARLACAPNNNLAAIPAATT